MDSQTEKRILAATKAKKTAKVELIQSLWSNYGELLRVHLTGGDYNSVILKHIVLPSQSSHPKGFDTQLSHQRKIKSYQVETNWYGNLNKINLKDHHSLTARCLDSFQSKNEFFILLEDLDQVGFVKRPSHIELDQIKVVLKWLASFHAKFISAPPNGLWQTGTYWHLETRPDELERLSREDAELRHAAWFIDCKLQNAKYQTIVHGDAKLANFCFSEDLNQVAAVDFQYVGGGCGMKDVAYFIGSCLDEVEAEKMESETLDFYFGRLKENLNSSHIDFDELEKEWRELYHTAWADFHRFLKGWSPGHWKINSYSEHLAKKVTQAIFKELLQDAQRACREAGQLVKSYWQQDFKIANKKGASEASSIVTEVDLLSQKKILSILDKSMKKYDLGLLAEEENDDGSRLNKEYFWCIDPLDGTLAFSEGRTGFAVSIALIDNSGRTWLGVVCDPVTGNLFHAVRNQGSFQNGQLIPSDAKSETHSKIHLFADRSLQARPSFNSLQEGFEIHFSGGAVMNSIAVLLERNACYFKLPKKEQGGCAIWDLAAVHLILEEAGGTLKAFNGDELLLNNPETIYFNKTGFIACGDREIFENVQTLISGLESI